MITVESINNMPTEAWKEMLVRFSGNPLHTPEVLSLECPSGHIIMIQIKDGEELIGIGIAAVYQTKRFRLFRGHDVLYLPTVPAATDRFSSREGLGKLAEGLLRFADERQCSLLHVGLRWGDDFSDIKLFQNSITRRIREFTINLEILEDEILSRMHKKHRKNIRLAKDSGMKIRIENSLESLMTLRQMQMLSATRNTEKGNPFSVGNESKFEEMHRNIYGKGLGKIYTAVIGDTPLAALAYLAHGEKAITVRSGATPKGYELCAMHLLQYELMLNLKHEGYKCLNIGGVPWEASELKHPQHGLYVFKRYFGGEEHVRTEVQYSIDLKN